ncbi:MAG: acyl-ACP thioesterase [Bacteroidetes bacterium]|nr:acyl-ACP thioesterase [Bacteroidota bacterium]
MNKTYSFKVQPQEVDFRYNITLASLTNILLTTAGYNADENGFGIRVLNQNECSWVLLRLAVEMNKFPQQYDEVSVETWVETVGRASTKRNFIIRDNQGNEIGKAVSNWAMINIHTRKAQDLSALEGIHRYATGQSIDINDPTKLAAVSTGICQTFDVKYSHIDINGHVSSMRYLEWVCDCLSLDYYQNYKIKRFEVNYLNEILYGENVSVFYNETEPGVYGFEIRKNESPACRAKIIFENYN